MLTIFLNAKAQGSQRWFFFSFAFEKKANKSASGGRSMVYASAVKLQILPRCPTNSHTIAVDIKNTLRYQN